MSRRKYILITGTSSGLGKALAEVLSEKNYTVLACVRKAEDKKQFVGNAHIIPLLLDVAKPADILHITNLVAGTTAGQGLYALINNAGMNYISAFELADAETERQLLEVNLLGMMALTRAMLPLLHKYTSPQKGSARIINISSIGGIFSLPWEAAYHASKFAVIGFSQSLRYELQRLGIDVSCFIPGGMKTAIFKKSVETAGIAAPAVQNPYTAYYQRNIQHMLTVMQSFDKSATPATAAARVVAGMLARKRMPARKYFGKDAAFIRLITFLGLQGLLKNLFITR